MNTYYIVRHGKTVWNQEHRTQGQKDSPLTEKAKQDIVLLRERLKNLNIDLIYSSDLKRAHDTANLLGLGLDIHLEKGFREIDFGVWEGMTIDLIKSNYSELYENWKENPEETTFIGGENMTKAMERIQKTFWNIDQMHNGKNILIVCHAMVIKLMLIHFLEAPMNKMFNIHQGNLALNKIKTDNKEPKILSINDMSHLGD